MSHASDWPTPKWVTDDRARTRAQMAEVLKAFGPIEAIVDYVSPEWGAVAEPDLFERPTRTDEVARYVEHRIEAAGLLYQRTSQFPSVAETRDLLQDLEARLVAAERTMRRLSHARSAFNATRGVLDREEIDPEDIARENLLEHDPWERLSVIVEDGYERVASLARHENLSDVLEQPPTNQKAPERVLWEAIFSLLHECGIEPLEKYQPLIHTLRAAHLLIGIDNPPNPGHVGYVKSEFLKQQAKQRH